MADKLLEARYTWSTFDRNQGLKHKVCGRWLGGEPEKRRYLEGLHSGPKYDSTLLSESIFTVYGVSNSTTRFTKV